MSKILIVLILLTTGCSFFNSSIYKNECKKDKLKTLDLSGKQLNNSILNIDTSKSICLESINLSNNNLDSFPNEILSFKELRVLNLQNNNISQIPSKISGLQKLKALNLLGNDIRTLPNEIKELKNLRLLIIINNPISIDEYERIKLLVNDSCKVIISYEFYDPPR